MPCDAGTISEHFPYYIRVVFRHCPRVTPWANWHSVSLANNCEHSEPLYAGSWVLRKLVRGQSTDWTGVAGGSTVRYHIGVFSHRIHFGTFEQYCVTTNENNLNRPQFKPQHSNDDFLLAAQAPNNTQPTSSGTIVQHCRTTSIAGVMPSRQTTNSPSIVNA